MTDSQPELILLPYVTASGNVVYMSEDEAYGSVKDVVLGSQGRLTTIDEGGGVGKPISVLPQERMASLVPEPTLVEAEVVMKLDPERLEAWEPVKTSVLNGWRFQLTPLPGGQKFKFLAFRSPADGGLFRIWVISPDMDSPQFYGHKNHMVYVVLGGERIAVLCGPGGRAARDLATARAYADKWALYTALKMRGERPLFSE